MLVFCHCPKTAGTSLFRAISENLGTRNSYLIKRERPSIATLRERNVKFVAGHVWYGYYAAQSDAAGVDGLHFFTFVRDPVQLTLAVPALQAAPSYLATGHAVLRCRTAVSRHSQKRAAGGQTLSCPLQ